jgi:hypothetical protein
MKYIGSNERTSEKIRKLETFLSDILLQINKGLEQ